MITIEDDGPDIEVRDDGLGMDAADLALAVERHSTSKLSRIEDLENGVTLGFRGEALAAISSVAELRIASRPRDSAAGAVLAVHFGQSDPIASEAMGEGTLVRVASLFAQHPARLKALRTPAAEFGAMQYVVQQLAIGNPDVQFRLMHNGRAVLETPGRGGLQAAILSVFGRDVAADLLPVEYHSADGWEVRGFVAPAHRHRANRFGEAIYINHRWVTNWLIRQGIEDSFRPQVPDRRFPYFWLSVAVPGRDVDPNAHPTKAEVRLYREHALRALLHRLVRETLEQRSAAPEIVSAAHEARGGYAVQDLALQWGAPAEKESAPVLHRAYQELVPLAQWRAKYIIAQGPQGLCLIDQHAAHERIYFEEFQRRGADVTLVPPLLLPLTETLAAPEWAAFEHHQRELSAWGFDVNVLGGTTIAVRGVPAAFHDLSSHQGLVRTVVELLSGEAPVDAQAHPVHWSETAGYAMAACKAAIKANRPMSMAEMQQLLDDMSRVEDPRGCPHGRPTMLVLTMEEVDRRFGRRG
jgi:DNA mismatch repair protein MutL